MAFNQQMPIRPMMQIVRLIQQDRPAFAPDTRAQREQPLPAFPPHPRISKTGDRQMLRRPRNHGFRQLPPGTKVGIGRCCQALHLAPLMLAVVESDFRWRRWRQNARVNQVRRIAVEHRTAAEHAITIVSTGRGRKRNRFMLPVDHVRADRMRPMHRSPERTVGVVLKKHVVTILIEDRAIGIVHPIGRREQMVLRPSWVRCQLGAPVFPHGVRPGTARKRARTRR